MLKEGDSAPAFSLPDQSAKTHHLSDYKGKWIVLYFYPKDMTPGCTTEACHFRDDYTIFSGMDVVILGISKDSIQQHQKFTTKYELPFALLSDENDRVAEAYGVWQKKSMYGKTYMGIKRMTFLIDPRQKIARIYDTVDVDHHSREIIEDLKKRS
jgi:thioredoxin-dependent peroxiredoxin